VGHIVRPVYTCRNKVEGHECGAQVSLEPIDLTQLQVSPFSPSDRVIKLDDEFTLTLTYPTIYNLAEYGKFESDPSGELDALVNIFDTITNTVTKETWTSSDLTPEQKREFLYSMDQQGLSKITDFIHNMPTLKHQSTFVCHKCAYQTPITFSGFLSFFD
jgi:T4 bacteriophage base plate protein